MSENGLMLLAIVLVVANAGIAAYLVSLHGLRDRRSWPSPRHEPWSNGHVSVRRPSGPADREPMSR